MIADRRFPDAPDGAEVTEEGWLLVGDEAWTEREWNSEIGAHFRRSTGLTGRHPRRRAPQRYATEEERQEAKRRSSREYMERQRGTA